MPTNLIGRRILAIVTNFGVEQDELVVPVDYLRNAGAHVDVAATTKDDIVTLVGDKEPGTHVEPGLALEDVDTEGYGLLIIPGGTINADTLRQNKQAIDLVREFAHSKRTIAAICHGPWVLVESGSLPGKQLTSYASLKTDITNAGGSWVDQSVVVDDTDGWTLITSRNPDDLPDFLSRIETSLSNETTPQ